MKSLSLLVNSAYYMTVHRVYIVDVHLFYLCMFIHLHVLYIIMLEIFSDRLFRKDNLLTSFNNLVR